MKELERTNRISISAVIVIVVMIIGLLGFKRPNYTFEKSSQETIDLLVEKNYFINKKTVESKGFLENGMLIDIRNRIEYEKGHYENAINIPTAFLLEKQNMILIEAASEGANTIVLYGSSPEDANGAWMMLHQLGIENVYLLNQEVVYTNGKFVSSDYSIEQPKMDFATVHKSAVGNTKKAVEKKVKRKPIVLKKKKKRKAEGGC